MVDYILPEKINNTGGLEWVFNYVGRNVPYFPTAMIVIVWFTILGAGFFFQKKEHGIGDFFTWNTIGLYIATTGAFILFLLPKETPGINLPTLIIFVVLTLLSTFILFVKSSLFGDN